jgi:hypothetical protein
MIVIFEQEYDIISIIDIIDDYKFDEYVNYYKKQLLLKENVLEICDEKNYDFSYSFKIKYNYKMFPTGYITFDYIKFESLNNFENLKK